jgi:two-component sensor histidine kinase/HAMP domain-containing protein
MRGLRDLSIKKKMMLIIMTISIVTLLLTAAGIAAFDMILFRRTMSYDLTTLARIIGDNSTAALAFRDQSVAREILSALKGKSHVVFACLYGADGKIFVEYVRPDMTGKPAPPVVRGEGFRFEQDHLALFHEIFLEQEKIGTLYIRYDLQEIKARFLRYISMITVFIFLAGFIAFLLSSRLQRVISRPILQLARAAHTVSVEKNYSIRVEKRSRDELGVLIEAFNEMLTQIQDRDGALQKAHDELETRVVERTNELHLEIIERKRAEEALRQLVKQKGILLKELQHRVKNSLAVVSGLLGLEMQNLADARSKEIFIATQSRIHSISSFYERLYNSADLERVDLRDYINDLAKTLQKTYIPDSGIIQIKTTLDEIKLDAKRVIPLGLIVNELIMNALKYAYPAGVQGEIRIDLKKSADKITLSVSDDGVGLPEELDPKTHDGIGLSLVRMLTKQIDGELTLKREKGTGVFIQLFEKTAGLNDH